MKLYACLLLAAGATAQTTVIRGGTVIPMTADRPVLKDHAIAVEDGVIRWIGPADDAPDGKVIDAGGQFVVPGFIDAHVHLFDEHQLQLFLANGITTVLNMSGAPFALEWRERIAAGAMRGPAIFTTGPQVKDDAKPMVDTEAQLPIGPADIEAFVRMHRDLGYDFLKIWSSIPPHRYEALVAECRRQGVRVTGHVPSRVSWRGVLASGQRSIAHVEELLNKWFVRELDDDSLAVARGIAETEDFTIISTLITYEMIADTMTDQRLAARMARPSYRYLDPMLIELWGSKQNDWWKLRNVTRKRGYYDDALEFLIRVTRELHAAGIEVLAGSDAGMLLANVVPGFSLHGELELLARAGMSSRAVLASTTVHPGAFLDADTGRGTIAVGAPADLVILRDDPLESISNTRSIDGLVCRGEHFDRHALDAMLAGVEAAQQPNRTLLQRIEADGVTAAAEQSREDRANGRPIPTVASLFVATYHRATAGDLGAAMELVELACELHPNSYRVHLGRGGFLLMAGQSEAARDALRRALELCPDHALIRRRLSALGR